MREIKASIDRGDDQTLGAALRGPTLLTGLTETEREVIRHNWRKKHFSNEMERVTRLNFALRDLDRGARLLLQFVAGLTDGEAIKQAEIAERDATEAAKRVLQRNTD